MQKIIKPTKKFKKQFKKRKHDPKWFGVFNSSLSKQIDSQKRSPWEFIIDCLIEDTEIPHYFYPHALAGFNEIKRQIKKQLKDSRITVAILELHFDGHNGDHLLAYVSIPEKVFLIGIGTHSELFE